jgi:hypothetical protein
MFCFYYPKFQLKRWVPFIVAQLRESFVASQRGCVVVSLSNLAVYRVDAVKKLIFKFISFYG